ncbi:MAG: hybrid sensor histidine kinase/response regulator [Proteobacteria bacterium]|nr:hybrid sensor histidine kinase/response regulator [Pseudomonadota bacterium]
MPSPEVLAVLADEVEEVNKVVISALVDMTAAGDNQDQFMVALESYREHVQRLSGACDILELNGLKQLCQHLELNLDLLAEAGSVESGLVLDGWPQLALGYLRAPGDGVYSKELSDHLRDSHWPRPMTAEQADALEHELTNVSKEASKAEYVEPRQTEAAEEDVVLAVPDEINPALLEAFLTEGPLQAAHYSELILKINRGEGWAEDVDEARRVIHALKGAANTVGVRGVASLSHHVEDILEFLADNAITPRGDLGKVLLAVADCLEEQFEALLGNQNEPTQALSVLQTVLDVANQIDRGEIDAADEKEPDVSEFGEPDAADGQDKSSIDDSITGPVSAHDETGSAEEQKQTNSVADAPKPPVSSPARLKKPTLQPARKLKTGPASTPVVEPKIRVAANAIDSMLRVSGEMAISRGHIQERLQNSLKLMTELRERNNSLWNRSNALEGLVDTQGVVAGQRHAQAMTEGGAVSTAFDPLEMDQYSELHTQVHGFVENIADLQLLGAQILDALSEVGSTVNQQTILNNELHNLLMNSRMLPVATLEPRLQRTVRQAADKSGKLAELVVDGGDVMLDDQMVNMLIDPMMHILRNAVDHGLESEDQRRDQGKNETGHIAISFVRDGNYLLINCQDDGAGLDLFHIHQKALDQGLVTEEQNLSDEEIARLILKPGFSTSDKVTELSGRGVGMDIVNTSINKLKGTINIKTVAGQGTTFVLRVPISIGITHCLLAEIDQQVYAIPTDNLDRIVFGGAANTNTIANRWFYKDEQDNCPIHLLSNLLGFSNTQDFGREGDQRPVIMMKDLDRKVAIVVDKVTSGRDLVIKGMGKYVSAVKGVIGASVLGDGSVIPILEVVDLFQEGRVAANQATGSSNMAASSTMPGRGSDILIVDDSLSVRTALTILLNGDGYEVRTAKDGLEAIDEIKKSRPGAVLVDMEMPRMNGLELTTHIRGESSYSDLPVIMITSRTAEKHRLQARTAGVDHYVTKPYRESDLLALLRSSLSEAA